MLGGQLLPINADPKIQSLNVFLTSDCLTCDDVVKVGDFGLHQSTQTMSTLSTRASLEAQLSKAKAVRYVLSSTLYAAVCCCGSQPNQLFKAVA